MRKYDTRREFLRKIGMGAVTFTLSDFVPAVPGISHNSKKRAVFKSSGVTTPPRTDYCEMLSQEIQGKKHGFLAGNLTYYIGGFYAVWNKIENETIGLTHPFFDDQRSRGTGMVKDDQTGFGHDLSGWEFYKETKIAYGTVIVNNNRYPHPVPQRMYWRPDKMICEYSVGGVNVREEKFIALNDIACTIITSDQALTIEFEGNSFISTRSVSQSATCELDAQNNAVHIVEGGEVMVRPVQGVELVGDLMYNGMSTVVSASRPLQDYSQSSADGVCSYNFRVSCDSNSVAIAWGMHDEYGEALSNVQSVLDHPELHLQDKTQFMNDLLNEQIPYFRCSEQEIVQIYYFLWAIYLMYYIDVGKGWEAYPHTQTAVNNFRGMHRYDAVFQSRVGSWIADKEYYAYGNVLLWKALVPFAQNGMLPDNMGISWHSGIYGSSAIAHVPQAWQIYEHSGDKQFLAEVYDFYKSLFWNGFAGMHWGYAFNAIEALIQMANELQHPEDVPHWNDLVNMDNIDTWLQNRWEIDTPHLFWKGEPKLGWSNQAYMGMNRFPNDWAREMTSAWSVNDQVGFFTQVPLATVALKDWEEVSDKFAVTPDTNWYAIRGMYLHHVGANANKCTLAHLKGYNMKWGIPIAPESLDARFDPWGDQYSNFNAGKILLILEGICGISYSIPRDEFVVADHMPAEWDYMEVQVPIKAASETKVQWIRVRIDRSLQNGNILKNIQVESNPFSILKVQPWLEERDLIKAQAGFETGVPRGHISYEFTDTTTIFVPLVLSSEISNIGKPLKTPAEFKLRQNFPNPFNSDTIIRYTLPHAAKVHLRIYDLAGHKVATLVNRHQSAGYHQINWNAKDFSSGVYYYEIQIDSFSDVKKMILLK